MLVIALNRYNKLTITLDSQAIVQQLAQKSKEEVKQYLESLQCDVYLKREIFNLKSNIHVAIDANQEIRISRTRNRISSSSGE